MWMYVLNVSLTIFGFKYLKKKPIAYVQKCERHMTQDDIKIRVLHLCQIEL